MISNKIICRYNIRLLQALKQKVQSKRVCWMRMVGVRHVIRFDDLKKAARHQAVKSICLENKKK